MGGKKDDGHVYNPGAAEVKVLEPQDMTELHSLDHRNKMLLGRRVAEDFSRNNNGTTELFTMIQSVYQGKGGKIVGQEFVHLLRKYMSARYEQLAQIGDDRDANDVKVRTAGGEVISLLSEKDIVLHNVLGIADSDIVSLTKHYLDASKSKAAAATAQPAGARTQIS